MHRCADALLPAAPVSPGCIRVGFVYASAGLAPQLSAIEAMLRERLGIEHWVGTVGLGVIATAQELYSDQSLVVLVGDLPADGLRLIPGLRALDQPEVDDLMAWSQGRDGVWGILHGDPSNPRTPELVSGLARALPGARFAGGLTSAEERFPQVAGRTTAGGISGILFDTAKVPVRFAHTQGCTPIGPIRQVTEAKGNIAITLDHRPALEVMKEDIGEVLARDLRRAAGYIFAGLPLGEDPNSGSDYLVRNLVGIDPDQGLIAIGDVIGQGQPLMFCRRDGNTARSDLTRMLTEVQSSLERPPRAAIYISCLGRGRHQFGESSQELKLVAENLGHLPLAGFFANGELFNNRLYGYTGVLTLFA